MLRILPLLCGLYLLLTTSVWAEESFFGKDDIAPGEAALMGILYDLKQTQDHKQTRTGSAKPEYLDVLKEFLTNNWDERILNRYYRVTKPLYTTQIFIPMSNANEAPKAFNAEKTVKPTQWLIHYRGQVVPPHDGTYRFWGYADNVCIVAVNGKLNLIGNISYMTFPEIWKSSEPRKIPVANGALSAGDWLDLKAKEPVDLDILIGEYPGGGFCAFLMVEEKGGKYETDAKGNPILPIFQLAPYDTPVRPNQPPFAKQAACWKGVQ